MPFYDLKCKSCGGEHNIMASMKARAENEIACPDCGSLDMETLYKNAPNVLKGVAAPAAACPNQHICGAGCHHVA